MNIKINKYIELHNCTLIEVRDKTLFTFQNNYNEADLRQCCATKNDLF